MAPKKENLQRRKRLRDNTDSSTATERNHPTGPHSAAKGDQFFAAADTLGVGICYYRPDERVRKAAFPRP